MDRETKKEFGSLARMVKRGFDDITEQMTGVRVEITGMQVEVAGMKSENGKRFDALDRKIDQSWGLIDGYVKAQEDFRDEFKIMKYKMDQMEKIIESKLGVAIE
jgi:hypothetical protein